MDNDIKKKYEYNILYIDTASTEDILTVLNTYGKQGFRFVKWMKPTMENKNFPGLKLALVEKEL